MITRFALAALALAPVGCGLPSAPPGTSCIDSTFCNPGLICHPIAKVCATKCSAPSDCPSNQKACAALGGAGDKFCQCSAAADCKENQLVCGEEERICLPRCKSEVDCTFNRSCDTVAGVCRIRI